MPVDGTRVTVFSVWGGYMPPQSFSAKTEADTAIPFRLKHYEWRSRSSYPKRKRPGFLRAALAYWSEALKWENS